MLLPEAQDINYCSSFSHLHDQRSSNLVQLESSCDLIPPPEDLEQLSKATTRENQTGRWTEKEHALFLEGLQLYGKSWKDISALVGTRTLVQIRTHAQKYLQKQSKPHFPFNKCYGQSMHADNTIDQLLEEDSSDEETQSLSKRKRDDKENYLVKTYQPIAPNYKRRRIPNEMYSQWSVHLTPLGWLQGAVE